MEGSEPGGATGSRAAMWVTLAAMTLSNSMILVDQTAVPLATPDAIRDLGGNLSQSQWLLTANILPLAALMVLGGRLGDLLGLSVRRSRSPARSRACSSSAVRTA